VVVAVEHEDAVLRDLAAEPDHFGVRGTPGVEASGASLLVLGCVVVVQQRCYSRRGHGVAPSHSRYVVV
jgi:hypothetical protein